jgi:glycosyltransferase involved in cell wall biosynthesis
VRILYSAIDQAVPSPHGGSVHVTSVAEGLSELGHEVHVLASPVDGHPFPSSEVIWWPMSPPLGDRRLRFLRAPDVLRRARALQPDVIIERYYNFGGEAISAARKLGATAVLEVNAPVADPPGSAKQWIDRVTIVQPLRRWRDWQCESADLIVTPSAKILPRHVPRARILETEWGADTDRFHPQAVGPIRFTRREDETVVIFIGAFRAWHGAIHLVDAMRELRRRGRKDIKAVLIGDGPELNRVRRAAQGMDEVIITGALPHAEVPANLAAAHAGIAPFDVTAHAPLQWEFYWSPLKIFEYMASGLPVVAPGIERLTRIVRDGREGLLYDPAQPGALASAVERLTNPALRSELGAAARQRAVDLFSWRSHCQTLDRTIRAAHDAHSHRH